MKSKTIFMLVILFIYLCVSYWECVDEPDPSQLPPNRDLNIRFYWQLHPMWCGHACVEMWAVFCNRYDIDQTCVAEQFCDDTSPNTGMEVYQISEAVEWFTNQELGLYSPSSIGQKNLLSEVTVSLQDGDPTILTTKNDEGYNHTIIVKGYTKSELLPELYPILEDIHYNDPASKPWEIDYYDFTLTRWWPIHGYPSEVFRDMGILEYGYFYIIGTRHRNYAEIKQLAAEGYAAFLKRCGTYYGGPQIYIPEGSTFLRVRYPQGAETLPRGQIKPITWESNNLSGNIRLELFKDGSLLGVIADNLPIENKSYNWTVGQYAGGLALSGDNYRIRVAKMDESYYDFSNVGFAIGNLTVTLPNGGERWEQNTVHNIIWDSSYLGGNVKITLIKIDSGNEYLIKETTDNDGVYPWIVGMCWDMRTGEEMRGMIFPCDCYKIKVAAIENPGVFDESDHKFAIIPPASITVGFPNGGESLLAGSFHDITWTGSENIGDVRIDYSTDNGNSWTALVSSTGNDGNYRWLVPDSPSAECEVRIVQRDADEGIADTSDGLFTITAGQAPGLQVISPVGGESIVAGSIYPISWKSFREVGSVNIEYSLDNGETWTEIVTATENDGVHDWSVPASPAATCLVRVREIDGEPSDASDSVFTIVPPPSLTVISPNGGESLVKGTIHEITWASTGVIPYVTIEYSTDNGGTWLEIIGNTANDGSYEWEVADTFSGLCLVRVSSLDTDGQPQDQGDAVFSIIRD